MGRALPIRLNRVSTAIESPFFPPLSGLHGAASGVQETVEGEGEEQRFPLGLISTGSVRRRWRRFPTARRPANGRWEDRKVGANAGREEMIGQ